MEIRSTRSNMILFWKVLDGTFVEEGQTVASLEQAKGSMSIVAPCDGKIAVCCDTGLVSEGQLLATVEQC